MKHLLIAIKYQSINLLKKSPSNPSPRCCIFLHSLRNSSFNFMDLHKTSLVAHKIISYITIIKLGSNEEESW